MQYCTAQSLNQSNFSSLTDKPQTIKISEESAYLDVVEIGVVLEGALEETGLLTQLGDVRGIVVREHLVTQDGISDLHKPKHT